MQPRRRFLRTALAAPALLLVSTGCGARSGVTATLDHGFPPLVGGILNLTLTVVSAWDAPAPNDRLNPTSAAEVWFTMTDGVVAAAPIDPAWGVTQDDPRFLRYARPVVVQANISQPFAFAVQLAQPGDFWVEGGLLVTFGQEGSAREGRDDRKILYLRVPPSGLVAVQRAPFPTPTTP